MLGDYAFSGSGATVTTASQVKGVITDAVTDFIVGDGFEGKARRRVADSRLHLAIASVSSSPMTIEAVTEVQACLHDMLQAIPVLEVNIEHSSRQHRAIVGAIIAGEATKARRAMEQHCDDTAALLRGLLG